VLERAVLAAMAAATTAACGGGQVGRVPAETLGPAELTFTSWWTDLTRPWGAAMEREVLPAFAKAHPAIKVTHATIESGDRRLEKLQALVAASTPPDVTFVSPWSIPPLAAQGAFTALDHLVRRDEAEFQSRDWFEEAIATGRWEGKLYGIPTDINVTNIYYNKALFDGAGVRYPTDAWTYADYLAAATRLTKGEDATRVWGTSLPDPSPHATVIWANGGRQFDDTFTVSLLDQPVAVDSLQWVADLRWKHAVAPRPDELRGRAERDLWLEGRIAMVLHGTHFLGSTRVPGVAFDWDAALPPRGTAKRAGLIRMAVCSQLAGSKHPAAWALVKHLSTPDSQRAWARNSLMPARRSAMSAFQTKPPAGGDKVVEAAAFAAATSTTESGRRRAD
jgi:multiple sugar transport system substrate-binding protein